MYLCTGLVHRYPHRSWDVGKAGVEILGSSQKSPKPQPSSKPPPKPVCMLQGSMLQALPLISHSSGSRERALRKSWWSLGVSWFNSPLKHTLDFKQIRSLLRSWRRLLQALYCFAVGGQGRRKHVPPATGLGTASDDCSLKVSPCFVPSECQAVQVVLSHEAIKPRWGIHQLASALGGINRSCTFHGKYPTSINKTSFFQNPP